MVKVSVIIPVYNVEEYLKQALDSVINQTFDDIEIICVNDGSTDSTYSIACAFATSNEKCHWTTKSDESSKIEEKHYGRTVRQYDDRNNYTHDECEDENGKRNKRTWEHGW